MSMFLQKLQASQYQSILVNVVSKHDHLSNMSLVVLTGLGLSEGKYMILHDTCPVLFKVNYENELSLLLT